MDALESRCLEVSKSGPVNGGEYVLLRLADFFVLLCDDSLNACLARSLQHLFAELACSVEIQPLPQ